MRILVSLLTVCLISSSAWADTKKENDLAQSRMWHLISLPAWYLAWVNVHEGSHALTAMAYEYEIISYKPYPHFEDGKFRFGSFKARCPQAVRRDGQPEPDEWSLRCRDGDGIGLIMIMPSVVDVAVFTASDILLSTKVVDPDSLGGRLLFMGGMAVPWIDLATASVPVWRNGRDQAQFAREIGVPEWSVAVLGNALTAVGLWRLYRHGREMFFDRGPAPEQQRMTLIPFSTKDSLGLSLRWQL